MEAHDPDTEILPQRLVDMIHEIAIASLLFVIRIVAVLNTETTEPACNADAGCLET